MTETASKKPTHIAKMPRKHGAWQEIGVAWATSNGGFNVFLTALPLDGKIVFVPAEK
jgi:hypothetical protein